MSDRRVCSRQERERERERGREKRGAWVWFGKWLLFCPGAIRLWSWCTSPLSCMLSLSRSLSLSSLTLADAEIPALSTHPHIAQKSSGREMKFLHRWAPSLRCGNTQRQRQFHNTAWQTAKCLHTHPCTDCMVYARHTCTHTLTHS